jgi:hypothetical protein
MPSDTDDTDSLRETVETDDDEEATYWVPPNSGVRSL